MSKLLSQGGFGCVFSPGISCNGTAMKTNKQITKLQKDGFSSMNEYIIGQLILEISNHKYYFAPATSYCDIDIRQIKDKYISKCNIIDKTTHDYILLKMNYIPNKPFIGFILSNNIQERKRLIIDSYRQLLKCIEKLLEKNVIHFDIKNDNILFHTGYELPIIIDFGISIPLKRLNDTNIKDYLYVYAPEYIIWPVEVHAINYILHKTNKPLQQTDCEQLTIDIFKHNHYISKDDIHDSLRDLIDKSPMEIIKESCYSWDNYAVSINFLHMISNTNNNDFFEAMRLILLTNISPFFKKRMTISDTNKHLEELFFQGITPK